MDNGHVISHEAPNIRIPIIFNIYWMTPKVFTPSFMATNSAPNTDVYIAYWFLKYQLINDMFIYITNLIQDLLVYFKPQ